METIKRTTVPTVRFSRKHGTSTSPSSDRFYDPVPGSLHLSTHHMIFESARTNSAAANATCTKTGEEIGRETDSSGESENEVWIPLSLLHSVTRTPPSFTGAPTPLVFRTRDFHTYSCEFESYQEVEDVFESVKELCSRFSVGGLENRWAFFCHADPSNPKNETAVEVKNRAGWDIYNQKEEFARMGVGNRSKAWRFTDINSDFNFCPSYPAQIVVPARISDTTLSYAVKYRSKCRIPGLVYLHWANHGSITRSSQPMVGITQSSRSIQDEKLIEAIFTSHSQHSGSREAFAVSSGSSSALQDSLDPAAAGGIVYGAMATNVIIDARPTKNAYANSVKGAGTENMTFYKNCRKEYLGIDNIHVMRASLNGVFQALSDAEITGQLDRLALRRTNWLSHLTNILEGTLIVIRTIHLSNSHVLVHCSDGWDRTSQLSALPQICLDPFYRTARGLAVLIEKDWIAYGHKFTDRSGHLCNDRVEFHSKLGDDATTQQSFLASVQKQFASSSHAFKETCPVFQQFLDCIYQIQRQFPERFEWNESLLRCLVWETYSGKTGSFLFNSEVERSQMKARERTKSVWEEFFDVDESVEGGIKLKAQYRNTLYDPTLDDPESKSPVADQGVLLFNPQDVRYWYELFGRSDDEMNKKPPAISSSDQPRLPPVYTEHRVVTSAEDDPVFDPLSTKLSSSLTLDPATSAPANNNFGSSGTSSARSTSPLPSRHPTSSQSNGEAPQQLAETVQKLGWSAWKSVQKFGQEAAKQYKERTAVEHTGTESGSGPLGEMGTNGWSSTPAGRTSNSGSKLAQPQPGAGGGMWSRLSTTISANPWQQSSGSDESSSVSSSLDQPIAYTPYQPRNKVQNLTPQGSYSAPHPVRQPSSALSINPWENISKEDALPTPSIPPVAEFPREGGPPKRQEVIVSGGGAGGGDPLGVGGF